MEKDYEELLCQVKLAIKHLDAISQLDLALSVDYSEEKHELKTKIKKLKQLIEEARRAEKRNPRYISKLVEQDYEYVKQIDFLNQLEECMGTFSILLFEMSERVNFDFSSLKGYPNYEMRVISEKYQLSTPSSLNKSREKLVSYLSDMQPEIFVKIINSELKLTGFKRFKITKSAIESNYIDDLIALIQPIIDKEQFRLLVTLIQDKFGKQNRNISPLEIISAVLNKYNHRQS